MKPSNQANFIKTRAGNLKCQHCQHDRFFYQESQLNTRLATFFNLDFVNKKAHCYICENCTNIQWFLEKQ